MTATTVQILAGGFFFLYGGVMLVKPGMFASRNGHTPSPYTSGGMVAVGASLVVVAVADNRMILIVLSMVMSVVGIVLIIVGLVKLRQERNSDG